MVDRKPLHIEVATTGAATVALALSGDLDYESVSRLGDLPIPAGCTAIDVDLSRLTFVDSSGLAGLVRLQLRAADAGAEVRVVALTPYLRSLFLLTAIDRLFSLPPG
ncbi:STAS domain-containing protein [Nonomuraea sp. NPDC001831]|uniref:STAS domain-containing protein n=1 Tax=Nonomuraea sp. NPDC001831 TaxID=3364340 RepID=UPI0036CA565D